MIPFAGFEDAFTTGTLFTVNVAADDVTVPQVPVTMQRYWKPDMASVTLFAASEEEVAPGISAKPPVELSCH